MLKCVIVDDEPLARECITNYVEKVDFLQLVGSGTNPLELVRLMDIHKIDLVFLDIQMPVMNGIEFRRQISNSEYLRKKSVPFIFLSTTATKTVVTEAYEMTVQGFFKKEQNVADIKVMLQNIIDYWQKCRHPNAP